MHLALETFLVVIELATVDRLSMSYAKRVSNEANMTWEILRGAHLSPTSIPARDIAALRHEPLDDAMHWAVEVVQLLVWCVLARPLLARA